MHTELDGENLRVNTVIDVADGLVDVGVSTRALERVVEAHNYVRRLVDEERVVYGVTTGFGSLSSKRVSREDAEKLQRNLVRSHSAGVGDRLPNRLVRAAMLLRLNTLLKGHSGSSPETVNILVEMLNRNIVPIVPEHGSLGASGDLAPLAHIALCVMGEGVVVHRGREKKAAQAFAEEGLKPVTLGAKEGLALINGTQMTTAGACIGIAEARGLVESFELASALTIQALGSRTDFLDERVHIARGLGGQTLSARSLREKLLGSSCTDRSQRVQEAYSIRCIPQVHGAAREALDFSEKIVEAEINAATDNPLLFPADDAVISGGNFHAQPVAMVLDLLLIAMLPLGNLSERRVERLLNPSLSGLPAFLTNNSGLNSGYMVAQYTAASILAECRVLAHPASVDTASVSASQEDHASMGFTAAKKLLRALDNLWYIAAVEALCAVRAVELAGVVDGLSPATRRVYSEIRARVPALNEDGVVGPHIEEVKNVLRGLATKPKQPEVGR
ncbi:MAG: histidine ammonia-lyase [Thermoprotei archaeon]